MKTYPIPSETDSLGESLCDSDEEVEEDVILPEIHLFQTRNSSFAFSGGFGNTEDSILKPEFFPRDISCVPLYLVAVLFIVIVPLALLRQPYIGSPPHARKSAAVAIITNQTHPHSMIVWSGMGYNSHLHSDLHEFNFHTRQWSKHSSCPTNHSSFRHAHSPTNNPPGRWKSGISQIPDGLLIFGGDAGLYDAGSRTWLLSLPTFAWSMQGEPRHSSSFSSPGPRQDHSLVSIPDFLNSDAENGHGKKNSHGNSRGKSTPTKIAVFGGQHLQDGRLLDDTWMGIVTWPNITWQNLDGAESSVVLTRDIDADSADTNTNKKKKKSSSPVPRRGHAAVLRDDTELPQMILFGGRTETAYLNDLWILDISSGEWQEIEAAPGTMLPAPRDHHNMVFYNGQLVVFGGRYGPTYAASRPLNDLWLFNFKTMKWNEAIQYGLRPLPRYLFSITQFINDRNDSLTTAEVSLHHGADGEIPPAMAGSMDRSTPYLFIFGGETLRHCKLNDLWSLNLVTLRWEQLSPPDFHEKKDCNDIFGAAH